MPACVRGYANRRPGIFYTFDSAFCANLCVFGLLFAQRMCLHASGVMPIGARGFFAHLFRLLCKLVRFWVVVCQKNVPACVRGYAVRRPGIFYTFDFTLCAVSYDFGSTVVSSVVNLVIRLVCKRYCLVKVCARMRPGLCR